MRRLFALVLAAGLLTGVCLAQDVTAPGNPIQGIPNDGVSTGDDHGWPSGEAPPNAIDNNTATKFLHFKGEDGPTGIRVTPTEAGTIVGAISVTTANDSAARDPVTWQVYGSNDSIDGPYMLIAEGQFTALSAAAAYPRLTAIPEPVRFLNDQPYDHYQVLFPQVRNPGGANSMQVAEIELIARPDNGFAPTANAGSDRVVILPNTELQLNGSVSDFETPLEELTYEWSQLSGPGTASFGGMQNQLDATVTFPAVRGLYRLNLAVTDGDGNDANDLMQVRVWDPAVDNSVIGHWPLQEGSGTTIADVAGANAEGMLASRPEGQDPNWVVGWIPGDGADNYALEFYDFGYVEIQPDPNEVPWSLNNVQWQIGMSAWFNADSWTNTDGTNANRRILQKGAADNQFRLLAENAELVFHLAGVGRLETEVLPPAGVWNHIAATYDGSMMRIFLNGMEIASMDAVGTIGTTTDPLFIATKASSVTVAGDYFDGMLDDLRITSYAYDSSEVVALAQMGENAPPAVMIQQPADLVLTVSNELQLEADVLDVNDDALTYEWTVDVANPTVDDPANVSLSPGNDVEDPIAIFAAPGTYIFTLTVSDGIVPLGTIVDSVTVNVENPTCEDVIAQGLGLEVDLNDDCRVTLADFAIFAQDWLRCIDPQDPECENPFVQP